MPRLQRKHRPWDSDKPRWERLRLLVKNRDKYRCQVCDQPGRLEVDHIVPCQFGGDPWSLENLQTICRGCHIQKTRAENRKSDPELEKWREFLRKG